MPRAAPPTRRGRGLTPVRTLRGPRSNVTEGVKTAKSDPNPGRTGTNGVNPGHCWVRRAPGPQGRASDPPGPRAHACTDSPDPLPPLSCHGVILVERLRIIPYGLDR